LIRPSNEQIQQLGNLREHVSAAGLAALRHSAHGGNVKLASSKTQAVVLSLLLAAIPARAQQPTSRITGTITEDATSKPLVGVQVFAEGTRYGTLTGADGRYALNLPGGRSYILVARFIGYRDARQANVSVPDNGAVTVDLRLKQAVLALEEIVVTGVVDPTSGAKLPFTVSKIPSEALQVPAVASPLEALSAKVAGANVIAQTGQPGTGAGIVLRTPTSIYGSNAPLFVVDGVILTQSLGSAFNNNRTLIDFNPEDIESIEVIKGAAAASIYGSRAAAGVIQIKTKRGSNLALGQTRVTSRTEYGSNFIGRSVPVSTHHHYAMDASGNFLNSSGAPTTSLAARATDANRIMDNEYPGQTFNNVEALYRPGQWVSEYLSISSNTEKTNFHISGSTRRNQGALENNDGFNLYEGRVNLDHRPSSKLSIAMTGSHSRSRLDDYSGTPFWDILMYQPNVDLTRRDTAGNYIQLPDSSVQLENPLWRQGSRDNEELRSRTIGSLDAAWNPLSFLVVNSQFSYDRADINYQTYIPKGTPTSVTATTVSDGTLERSHRAADFITAAIGATAMRNFYNSLNTRLTLRGSMERDKAAYIFAQGTNFIVKDLPDLNAARTYSASSTRTDIRVNSFLADLAADYKEKYIFGGLIRRDGSSLFGPEERWQTFYRVSGAYRLSQEPWFHLPHVSDFKLRYSRGTSGNRPSFYDQYETWDISSTGVSKSTLGNRFLRPEMATEQEFGLDMIFNGRVSAQFVYATQKTDGQIINMPQPAITGYPLQKINSGVVSGHTFETTIEAQVLTRPNLSWTMGFVADRSKSRIDSWNRSCFVDILQRLCTGGSLADMWGQRFLTSVDQLPASLQARAAEFQVNDQGYLVWVGVGNTYRDGIAKGLWNTASFTESGISYKFGMPIVERDAANFPTLVRIGTSLPDLSIGWWNSVRWGNFSFFGQFQAQIGGDIYNNTRQRMYQNLRHGDLDQTGKAEDLKKPIDYYQALYNSNENTSHFVEDGTFLKLRELSAMYRLRRDQLAKIGLGGVAPSELSIGLTGRNLITFTNYSGFDPQIGFLGDADADIPGALTRYDTIEDGGGYPLLRNLTMTVQIVF
jgi:TonB-linked SusC/RagA family outer membrane protein